MGEAGNLLAIALLVILVICSTSRRTLIRNSAIAGALLVAMFLLLPLGPWALMPLEQRFARPDLPNSIDGVLVLGGGADNPERFLAVAGLARSFPNARIVFSDIDANAGRTGFRQIGIDPSRTVIENRARNTWENISFAYALLKPRKSEKWVLVTSAYHIPRAMGVADKLGWDLIAWPVGSHGGPATLSLQFTSNLEKLEIAGHEWVGLLAYWVTGKSDRLFPRPVT